VNDDLRSIFAPEVVEALERLADERAQTALVALRDSTPSPWLSIQEAAGYLRTSERTIQRLVKRGRLRSTTLGRRRLLHRDDLDTFVRATTGEGTAPTVPPRRRAE
jgi:excisionase family DNA binding protein